MMSFPLPHYRQSGVAIKEKTRYARSCYTLCHRCYRHNIRVPSDTPSSMLIGARQYMINLVVRANVCGPYRASPQQKSTCICV